MSSRKRIRGSASGGGGTTIINVGGGQGLGLDMGAETQDDTLSVSTSMEMGGQSESSDFSVAPNIATGNETSSAEISLSGSATYVTGTETSSQEISAATTFNHGSESASLEASASAVLAQHTQTATSVINSGSTAWTDPSNAQGPYNGTEAEFSLESGLALTSGDADLRCVLPGIGATPTGFTRTAVVLSIVYRFDLQITLPLVDTARVTITLRSSTGTLLATLISRTEDDGTTVRPTLTRETYTITPPFVSEAQLSAGLQVWVNASASLSLTTSGNMSCQVDGCHLETSYTRSGIT